VKDVAKHDTNEVTLEQQLHPTKCDKKDDTQFWATGWCKMCSVKNYRRIEELLKKKQYQTSHWIWLNDYLHTFPEMHEHVHSYRKDLVLTSSRESLGLQGGILMLTCRHLVLFKWFITRKCSLACTL